MTEKNRIIRIKAKRLGTVKEVRQMLKDFDNAYSSIYAFNFLVDSLQNDRRRWENYQENEFEEELYFLEKYLRHLDSPKSLILFKKLWHKRSRKFNETKTNLLELQSKLDINKIVLTSELLVINKINIQSPGFWEFLGSLNPLQQIREYLNDRHERNKDKKYRSRQEEELNELTIIEKTNNIAKQKIEILKGLGYSPTEIRQFVSSMIVEPLNKLGIHQDKGLIDGEDKGE